jgi:hypothetical protein
VLWQSQPVAAHRHVLHHELHLGRAEIVVDRQTIHQLELIALPVFHGRRVERDTGHAVLGGHGLEHHLQVHVLEAAPQTSMHEIIASVLLLSGVGLTYGMAGAVNLVSVVLGPEKFSVYTVEGGALVVCNPIAVRSAWFGQNDAPSILFLVRSFALFSRGRYGWSAAAMGASPARDRDDRSCGKCPSGAIAGATA